MSPTRIVYRWRVWCATCGWKSEELRSAAAQVEAARRHRGEHAARPKLRYYRYPVDQQPPEQLTLL